MFMSFHIFGFHVISYFLFSYILRNCENGLISKLVNSCHKLLPNFSHVLKRLAHSEILVLIIKKRGEIHGIIWK